jgi:catechol 2,3-dioxygenase-like lactoylglutathione lyase family enzyme
LSGLARPRSGRLPALSPPGDNQLMRVREVLETCLCVADLAAAEAFYRDLLGLELFDRQEGRHLFFRCGQQMFLLFDPGASNQSDGKIPPHGTSGPGHVCFAAREDELPAWQAQLAAAGIDIEAVVDWPGGGRSIYFRDPAGNCLEIATPRIWGLAEPP